MDQRGTILKQSVHFYNKYLNHSLLEQEIRYKSDGTTVLKLQALPKVVNFFKSSRMTTTFDTYQPQLHVDRLVGNISYCLGFVKESGYYVPTSCLLGDIRDFSKYTSQILAVLSKPSHKSNTIYNELKYTAKGLDLKRLSLPKRLSNLIEL